MKHHFEIANNGEQQNHRSLLSSEVLNSAENKLVCSNDSTVDSKASNYLPRLEIAEVSEPDKQSRSTIRVLLSDPVAFRCILDEHGNVDRNLLLSESTDAKYSSSIRMALKDLLKSFDLYSTDGQKLNPDVLARNDGIELSCSETSRLNLARALQSDPELFGRLTRFCKIDKDALSGALNDIRQSPEDSFWSAERKNILEQLKVSFAVLSGGQDCIELSKLDADLKLPIDKAPTARDYFSLHGLPTISAEKIDEILAAYKSPMSGQGQQIFDIAFAHGIDPAVALAFFEHESTCGTMGVARKTKGWGNVRDGKGGFLHYKSWEEGFVDWCERMQKTYLADTEHGGFGLQLLDDIVPVYAPSSDGNAPRVYIRKAKMMITEWREH